MAYRSALACLMVLAVAPTVIAQGTAVPGNPAKSSAASSGDSSGPGRQEVGADAAMLPGWTDRIRFLINDKNELVPVPADARLQKFLEWLGAQNSEDGQELRPQVAVSAIEMSGTADDQFARVDVRLQVQLSEAPRPVQVALGLQEGVILSSEITGPATARYAGKDLLTGYRWWLDLEGNYEFRLKMLFPVRRALPWRRLLITIPPSPIAQLQLQVPEATAVVKVPEEVLVETNPVETGGTDIRISGLTNRADLQWQSTNSAADQRVALDVNTTLLVRSSGDGFLVDATQYVKALQGAFKEFTVRLPKSAELLSIDGADLQETIPDPKSPERIKVVLSNTVASTTTVRWSVRLPQSPSGRTILDGFVVDRARRQSGEIGLIASDNMRWAMAESSDPKLERMNAAEMSGSGTPGRVARAYRYFEQPFHLPLQLQKVEPFYDIRPNLVLFASRDELRLEGQYDVRTFRGELAELSVVWPNWKNEGWRLEAVQPAGTIVTGIASDDAVDSSRISLEISPDAPDNFRITLSARCPMRPGDLRLTLPQLVSPSQALADLAFGHAENVDAELTAAGETVLRPLIERGDDATNLPAIPSFDPSIARRFRLETDERQVVVRVTPQPLKVQTESQARVELIRRRFEVTQRLIHLVQYERVSQLTFSVPESIVQSVRFHLGQEELLPVWEASSRPKERLVVLTLPKPALGNVEIVATWSLLLPEGIWTEQQGEVSLALIGSQVGQRRSNRMEFVRPTWLGISTPDPAWSTEFADEQSLRWSADPTVTTFEVHLTPSRGDEGADFVATQALASAFVDRLGRQVCSILVRISGTGSHLNVQLPGNATPGQFSWDGIPVSETELTEVPPGSRRYTLPWPGAEGSREVSHLLKIEYLAATAPLGGIAHQLPLSVPILPQCRWSADVIWDIELPSDQHLFSLPRNVSPMFTWRRSGFLWRRHPVVERSELAEWIGERPVTDLQGGVGHRYTFSQVGALQDLRFQLLSTAAAFLAGTGLSLTLGFLLIKLPQLQNAFVFLTGTTGALFLALWMSPQVELLLQPMALGAVLAVLLGLQEFWQRRRSHGTILTLASATSDLHPPSAENRAAPSLLVRTSDSATIYRETPRDETRLRDPVESHVG